MHGLDMVNSPYWPWAPLYVTVRCLSTYWLRQPTPLVPLVPAPGTSGVAWA